MNAVNSLETSTSGGARAWSRQASRLRRSRRRDALASASASPKLCTACGRRCRRCRSSRNSARYGSTRLRVVLGRPVSEREFERQKRPKRSKKLSAAAASIVGSSAMLNSLDELEEEVHHCCRAAATLPKERRVEALSVG